MMRAKSLVRSMAVFVGFLAIVQLAAQGNEDPPPTDLSRPRLTASTPQEGQVQEAEREFLDNLVRNHAETLVIKGMPGVLPPDEAKPADPGRSAWTRPSQLRPWLQKAGIRQFEGGQRTIKVVVGRDEWKLDDGDLHFAVSASVAAQAEGKPAPRIEYLYPLELAPLQKAYEEAVEGGNTKIEGLSERLILIELPKKTARMIDAMLFYGFDALFVRSDPGAWSVELVKQRLGDLERSIQIYFIVQMTGLVDPYVLGELKWKDWTLPTPTLDRNKVIQDFFTRDRPKLRTERRPSFSTMQGRFTVIEIGGGNHFHYTRFIVPVDNLPPTALAFLKEGKFPIKQPEYYFSSRWWFTNVIWQIAAREHRYIDFDPKTFIHGQPRMAWYPVHFLQFGPP